MTGSLPPAGAQLSCERRNFKRAGKCNERLGSREKQLRSGTVPPGANQPAAFDLCSVTWRAIESLCG
jgi:hypothetical protein